MISTDGFVDLRVDAHHRQSDDTVWPSFTDVMTVVVMIFLFVLIVILIRNVELVKQLRATMEAERAAAAIARTTEQQKETLTARLVGLEEQVSRLRLQLLRSQEQQQETSAQLAQRANELTAAQKQRDQTRTQLQQAENERNALQVQVTGLVHDKNTLANEKTQLEKRVGALSKDLTSLRQRHSQQEAQLSQLRQQTMGDKQQLVALQGEYVKLKKKYDRLIKPARTALGKYVVEVRYDKPQGRIRIGAREPKQAQYQILSSIALHQHLVALKKQWGNKLYTKIVIPDNSGLSYTEAWEFTNDILSRYDYYYQ